MNVRHVTWMSMLALLALGTVASAATADVAAAIVGTWDGEVQLSRHEPRELVICSATGRDGTWAVTAMYGIPPRRLSSVAVSVETIAGVVRLKFQTGAQTPIDVTLMGENDLVGTFTLMTTSGPYSTRIRFWKRQASFPPAQRAVDPKQIAGEWEGRGRDGGLVKMSISETGTYRAVNAAGQEFSGQMRVDDGQFRFNADRTDRHGTAILYEADKKRILETRTDDCAIRMEFAPAKQ